MDSQKMPVNAIKGRHGSCWYTSDLLKLLQAWSCTGQTCGLSQPLRLGVGTKEVRTGSWRGERRLMETEERTNVYISKAERGGRLGIHVRMRGETTEEMWGKNRAERNINFKKRGLQMADLNNTTWKVRMNKEGIQVSANLLVKMEFTAGCVCCGFDSVVLSIFIWKKFNLTHFSMSYSGPCGQHLEKLQIPIP